ncbi:MAG: hypothetical protein HYX29_09535 [Solirubrobacterales bacterium]|nr:hypothetical protein [Solirubrobacterales bacterium]
MLAATNSEFSQYALIAGAIGAGVVLLAFIVLIAWPAWNSYGRNWERVSALFLSLYVLVAMLGIGAMIGLGFFALFGEKI